MVMLVAAPFGWTLSISLGALTLTGSLVLASVLSPMVVVDQNRLLAGKMSIPLSAIGSTQAISEENLRAELGPKLDARAQLLIRGDLRNAVRIDISDENDPTPYLVISTRRPADLVRALGANSAKFGL